MKNQQKITKLKTQKTCENSLPKPKKVHCFQCKKNIYIKFVFPRKDYSQKNNWDYWTGQKKKQHICDHCLIELYGDKPLYENTVKDLKKRNLLHNYFYRKIIYN